MRTPTARHASPNSNSFDPDDLDNLPGQLIFKLTFKFLLKTEKAPWSSDCFCSGFLGAYRFE
jgi:hypothetical protein